MHEQCVTCCTVSRLVHSPGCPASVITWKISSQDSVITILGSQLTRLARLSCNRKVDAKLFYKTLTQCQRFKRSQCRTSRSITKKKTGRYRIVHLGVVVVAQPANPFTKSIVWSDGSQVSQFKHRASQKYYLFLTQITFNLKKNWRWSSSRYLEQILLSLHQTKNSRTATLGHSWASRILYLALHPSKKRKKSDKKERLKNIHRYVWTSTTFSLTY